MLTQRADIILRKLISLINISANLAHKSLFAFGLWLWFHILLIIGVGHSVLIAHNAGLCNAANEHSVSSQIYILLYLQRHKSVNIFIQENQSVIGTANCLSGKFVYASTGLETKLLEKMAKELLYISEHSDQSVFHLMGHLYLFLDLLAQSAPAPKPAVNSKMSDYYIKEAINFIEQNFQNDISIEDVAAVCGINRSYLGRIFRTSTGRSPQEFLISYRMTKAAELLKLTTLSVSDIGCAVGYENPLHFSRAFKNVYGVSPREWRNLHK